MGRRGRKRRLAVEDEYWQLIRSGVGTVEACGRVGIGRKTGFRWRAERGGIPPVRLGEGERSGRYLALIDRHRGFPSRRECRIPSRYDRRPESDTARRGRSDG